MIREGRPENKKSQWPVAFGCLCVQWSEAPWPVKTDAPLIAPLLTEESPDDKKFH